MSEKPAAKDAEPTAIVDANSAAVEAYRHPIEGPPEVAPKAAPPKKGT